MPLVAILLLLCAPSSARAHAIGSSLVEVEQRGATVSLAVTLHTGEAALFAPIDLDRDGLVSEAELGTGGDALAAAVLAEVGISVEAGTCVRHGAEARSEPLDGLRLAATWGCPAAPSPTLSLALGHLARLPPEHRALGRASLEGKERAFVADASQAGVQLRGEERGFGAFVALGVEHILLGFDHLLFLAALLLVVRRLREAAAIVTGFTVAHSLTLGAAVLGWLSAPERLVEAGIAASIVVVAADNLLSTRPRARPLLTFAFGLLHGFGFARVLAERGLQGGAAVVPLLGFNLGVELGQLACVALVLPPLLRLRRWPSFEGRVVPAGSALVAAAGAYWLVERLS